MTERVCYAQPDGCRWENTSESLTVRESQREPLGPTSTAVWSDTLTKLTAHVMAMLGSNGWEMVGGNCSVVLDAAVTKSRVV